MPSGWQVLDASWHAACLEHGCRQQVQHHACCLQHEVLHQRCSAGAVLLQGRPPRQTAATACTWAAAGIDQQAEQAYRCCFDACSYTSVECTRHYMLISAQTEGYHCCKQVCGSTLSAAYNSPTSCSVPTAESTVRHLVATHTAWLGSRAAAVQWGRQLAGCTYWKSTVAGP